MSWYVLHTNPRWEKKVAERLQSIDVEVYCPIVTELRQWSDRTKKIRTPLFKGFLFVKISEKQRHKVFEVPGVVRYMYWLGKPAVVRDAEIETIREWLEDEKVDQMEIDHISPGDKLTLSNGAFKNQEAVVREIGKKRIRLVLPKMGCTVVVKTKVVH